MLGEWNLLWLPGDYGVTVGIVCDDFYQNARDEDNRERRILKYFSIFVACVVGVLAIISRWVPSIDLTVRIILLTSILFGTTIVLRRKELRRKATWMVLTVGALIHFVVFWVLRERLVDVNMWGAGGCAIVEGLLLQVSIEICKPPAERWNS
jgi:hypothetical protein